MLLDLVIKSVNQFQDDCLKLCERHYPTVHNQGISEHHIGKAFARRMEHTFVSFNHASNISPLEMLSSGENPRHFRISSEIGTVWMISHHMVSAGKICRKKLMLDIHNWQQEYGFAIQPNDVLIIVSDHWISRSKNSGELLHWWMGELPDEITEYSQQGITLRESDSQFATDLNINFRISPCFIKFGHPLKRSGNQQLVRKYLQLYAVLQWQ
ncbi:hypothetical protein VCRA2123O444_50092 [Vibrio crassostreae]|uniref:hypothetical protein n=1 Tax=Vibrio crassostreae TaxID=246167 RepID=UPI001B30F50B|nr:hypothetical protein [Vibrio crassostreae]CAK2144892.1 hypothetical protein VCRA2114O422_50090 [Vibrio crassostreae]CAK2145369.1 hypothetical protein VCRA2119O431_50060 [Vibrio crassostreae]CAK2169021.1 hypothetical protein VCRA2119O430_60091 [Vibrio crassostreae]CAK2172385.1 hypothetical protein VCRA2113O414_70060 [Vibrio crassostreae]CAK2173831.1 hypothetical protein VCRA2113O409_70093 [Vibrio crassostreae]